VKTAERFLSIAFFAAIVATASVGTTWAGTSFECVIDGTSNVPPNPVPGTGTGSFVLNDAQTELSYYIEFGGLVAPEIAAHFHNAGTRDNGPAVFNLPLGSPKVGVWQISPEMVAQLFMNRIYVNIHSEVYILGELRGNLMVVATGVGPNTPSPLSNALKANYPNPFNPRTTIEYGIDRRAHVSLKVYDASGQQVRTLVDRVQSPGEEQPVIWDGRNDNGESVASGVYYCTLVTGDFSQTRKMVFLK
jgi:hypothetical protein